MAAVCLVPVLPVTAQAPEQASPFTPAPCEDVIGFENSRVSCGWLAVKEMPRSRDLELAVSIVRAAETSDEPPVVFLHGGPGGAIAASANAFVAHPMSRNRNVILFDQRGSGLSKPQECLDASRRFLDVLAADLEPEASVVAQAQIESACRQEMLDDKADLRGYGTRRTVEDMETLRRALGIETWNVMGVSYGTTVALDYVRTYPERTRALVLDSVYPPSMVSGSDINTRSFARALDELYSDCRADPVCRRAYPGLETSFLATLIALGREPLAIPVRDASLVPAGTFYMNPQDLAVIVQQMLYQRETISLVPKIIDLAAQRKGDALAGMVEVLGPLAQRIDLGARLAVECRERWQMPGRTLSDMTRLERFLGERFVFFDTEDRLCPGWTDDFEHPSFNEPVGSPVPALFLAGANDPITPPRNTILTYLRFPAGQLLISPHAGHGVGRTHACVRAVTADFLDDPREIVADACMARVTPIPFVTDVAYSRGVLPFARDALQERGVLTVAGMILAALGIVGGIGWTLAALVRRRPGRGRPGITAVLAGVVLAAAGIVAAVFYGGLVSAVAAAAAGPTPAMLALGVAPEHGWLFGLPLVFAALTGLGLLALAATALRGGGNALAVRPLGLLAAGAVMAVLMTWVFGFFLTV